MQEHEPLHIYRMDIHEPDSLVQAESGTDLYHGFVRTFLLIPIGSNGNVYTSCLYTLDSQLP